MFAMEAEAQPLIQKLGLVLDDPPVLLQPAPCISYSGKVGALKVHLVWNGRCEKYGVDNVGTVPAALTSYLGIQAFKPDLVISAGTAGGFKARGAAIGDVFLSSGYINHDRRIPIPGFDAYGLDVNQSVPTPNLQKALNLKLGVVSSGNSLDYTDKCMTIMNSQNVAVKEMEAAAIAWVCSFFQIPMFCVKAVTDIVDGDRPSQEEFLENLAAAAKSLQATLPQVLSFIEGKTVAEL